MLFKEDQVARAQHAAVRNNVGWYRWNHDLVEVTGADATRLLDVIFVTSIATTPAGSSKYTTMLDEEGHIIDDVIVTRLGEQHYWVSTLYGPRLTAWLDRHKGDLDVEYREITREVAMVAVQGPNSRALVNRLADEPVDALKRFTIVDGKIGDMAVRIHRGGFSGELGYEIMCAMADLAALEAAIAQAGEELDAVHLTVLEVYVRGLPGEKGLPLRQDLYGLSPYEADLGWSVDLSKDFIGKEAALRVKEAGPQRKLVGLEFAAESYEDITQGERVRSNGVDIGLVRAIMYGYTIDKNIGFAVVRADKAVAGTPVQVGPNRSPAVIVERRWV